MRNILIFFLSINIFYFQLKSMKTDLEINNNEKTPLTFNIQEQEKNNKQDELYNQLYEFLKKKDYLSARNITSILKKMKNLKSDIRNKYLKKTIKENNFEIATFWVENFPINYDHLYTALKTSKAMTNIILKKFDDDKKENQKKLLYVCEIINKTGGLPKKLTLYLALFGFLRKLIKITPINQLIGYQELKRFVEEKNIITLVN